METQVKRKQIIELRTDIKLLLECLEYQKDDEAAVKQALVTLSSILQGTEISKEIFRDAGGVDQVLELVTSTQHQQVTEAGLYCLGSAVERNVYTQKLLSTAGVFTFLHSILSARRGSSSLRKKQTATFLLICLVTNNGYGQNLARQASCLQDIISLIRTSLPQKQTARCDWLEDVEGNSVDLWTALVSAACASVNNPINDENQRLCACLLPFVFNVLSKYTDATILKSALCLVGLTAANNAPNQDRVRQCGGLDMLVKKFRSVLTSEDDVASSLPLLTQIMATLDACVSDNERSSKKLGELDGVTLVLQLMSEGCLPSQDMAQGALLLAHVVEAFNENKRYISEGGKMNVLIQQLTETDHEEVSKTIKYLLHLCVASDATEDMDTINIDADQGNRMEVMMSKMEKMRRHNDFEVLKKIQELDDKLHNMETRQSAPSVDRHEAHHSSEHEMPTSPQSSFITSSRREDSLLEELTKEKLARQKLQRLNEMLQEDICASHTALGRLYSPTFQTSSQQGQGVCQPVVRGTNRDHKQKDKAHPASSTGISTSEGDITVDHCAIDLRCQSSGQHCLSNFGADPPSKIIPRQTVRNANFVNTASETEIYNACQQDGSYKAIPVNPRSETPLDLSFNNSVSNTSRLQSETLGHCRTRSFSNASAVDNVSSSNHPTCEMTTQTVESKNAEIQCGTPYVTSEKKGSDETREYTGSLVSTKRQLRTLNSQGKCDVEKNDRNMTQSVNTFYQQTTDVISDKALSVSNVNKRACLNRNTNALLRSGVHTSSLAVGEVTISKKRKDDSDITQTTVVTSLPQKKHTDAGNSDKVSTRSSEKFVKPVALPPKSKVRVTPLLGSNKMPKPRLLSNITQKDTNYDSDAASEFDTALLKKRSNSSIPYIKNMPQTNPVTADNSKLCNGVPISKASYVIKSQNNVWRLDRQLESRAHNAADKWCAIPSTPRHQSILPVRPAFSDCGTRRTLAHSPDSPCSVKSVGKMMDDSGIHSPPDLRNLSASSNSPVDSNVDELRSSSDVSEVDDGPPSITRAALRSSRLVKFERQDNCPGCQSAFKLKGPLLTSKTYTIELETNPNTCQFHRQVRQVERQRVQKLRKAKANTNNTRHQTLVNTAVKKKKKSTAKVNNKNDYDMSSDESPEDILSNDESPDIVACRTRSRRRRRKRVSYSAEEVANLRKGVERFGKHWYQILVSYQFHPSRTNVDLMEKYKRIRLNEGHGETSTRVTSVGTRTRRPFSMCEERRLLRGVAMYGCNWKCILQGFRFTAGRTTEELRNKWRTLQKQGQAK